MSEVPYIKARTIVLNDVHRHIINAAYIAAHPQLGPKMYRRLRRLPFDQELLDQSRQHCILRERSATDADPSSDLPEDERLQWACAYFSTCWMGRSAKAGTTDEFKGGLPLRWNAGGGDSAVRYHNAVLSLPAWRRTLRRCNFSTLDFRKFLAKCKDAPRHGIYSDSPFPDAGDTYKHDFTREDHRDLAKLLAQYKLSRIVVRFYDHPLVRELYPESIWQWQRIDGGRDQANQETPEVLLIRN
jgi:site-specific DNA-adenine methylase